MPNRPLRVCPVCATGHPTLLRSGAWLNDHCPKLNGPMDADDFPEGHELDNWTNWTFCRCEYKRPGEEMLPGQIHHLRFLDEAVRQGVSVLLVLVSDEGQQDVGQQVAFRWLTNRQGWRHPRDWPEHRTVIDALGREIADWVYRRGPQPAFTVPPPPTCAACGGPRPRTPQQTMPVLGKNSWVCAACFRRHFGLKTVA